MANGCRILPLGPATNSLPCIFPIQVKRHEVEHGHGGLTLHEPFGA